MLRLLYGVHSVASLAYEIVWIKILAGHLGMSLAAMGTVLGCFVGGLGLGGAAAAFLARRASLRLRTTFAAVQLALAVWGAAFPWLLAVADRLYVAYAPPLESSAHLVVRAAVAAALLLPPSILIGMVFPLLGAAQERDEGKSPGHGAGSLFMEGLLWSAVGSLVLPALAVPALGLKGTSLLVAALCAAAAASSRSLRDNRPSDGSEPPFLGAGPAPLRLTLVLGFASGALLLAVEVVAANFLWLIMDATVYAEGIMVGTVMIVMGAGSALYLRGRRAGAPVRGLVMAAFALFSLSVAAWLTVPASLARFSSAIMTTGRAATPAFFAAQGALVLLVLGGPALAIGAVYTALCEWAISAGGRSPRPLGRLSACHYAGALVGNLATVFFLLPRLGMTTTLAWTGLAAAIASSLVWTAGVKDWRRRLPRLAALAVAVPFFLLAPRVSDLTFRVTAAGPNRRVLFHEEDGAGVVEVFEVRETGHRQLFSNRLLGEGEDSPVARVLKWQEGSLPALLHPAPRRVLAIGLGTGMTLRGLLRPEVERLVCVEYSRGVIEAAPFFAEATGPLLTDPRFVLLRQDGRDFLRLTRDLYDLIVQDLFFPYRAGVGNLYTVEHYRRLAARLSSGGRAGQWIALHQISPEDLRSLVASFSKAFPDTTLWLNGRFLLLYGGQEPLHISWPDFARRAEREAPVPGTDAADLLSQRVAFAATPGPIGPDVRPNTDDNALIEYRTPLVFNKLNTSALEAENLRWILAARRADTTWLEDVAPRDRARLETASEGRWLYVAAVLRRIEGGVVSEEDMQRIERSSASLYLFRRDRANGLVQSAVQALQGNQPALALPLLNQALTWDPAHLEARFFLAQVAFDQGETVESLRLYGSLLADFSRFHLARKALIHTLCRAGRPEEARRETEVLNRLDPESGATRALEEACGGS